MADIVLPATMFMEHDDLYYGGGHQHISVGAKLIDPPGECRSNHEVLQGLGRRLNAVHPAFDMTAARIDRRHAEEERPWRYRRPWRRICGATCSRISAPRITSTVSRMRTRSSTSRRTGRIRRSATPAWAPGSRCRRCRTTGPSSRRRTRRIRSGSPPVPSRSFLNTSFNETPSSIAREGAPSVMIHPADAASLGIADGDAVTLGNVRGETTLTAKLFDGAAPRRADRGIGPAEQGPYRRSRHQHADRRRGGRADRRRGVPRQQGLGEEGRASHCAQELNPACSPPSSCRKCLPST